MSHVDHGRTLYANGHYVEAAAVFEQGESSMAEADQKECAQYGTYRGLTLLVLGDLAQAERWLAYAYAMEQREPGVLNPRLRLQLDRGWSELLQRGGPATTDSLPANSLARDDDATSAPSGTPMQNASGVRRSFVDP